MTIAINAIRRLEAKVDQLATTIKTSTLSIPSPGNEQGSAASTPSYPSPGVLSQGPAAVLSRRERGSVHEAASSPHGVGTPKSPYPHPEGQNSIHLSFSQHEVPLWPAMLRILPPDFVAARKRLPREYFVEIENQRLPLPLTIAHPPSQFPEQWLTELPVSVIKGLADAYFAVFHRNTPVLDKFYFFSNTLGVALENDFGYDIETCVVLNVLALGCLAVKAHEEGDFPLPSRFHERSNGFVRPEWYELILDDPSGLKFFNEARKRFGFLMCQNDLQTAQFYHLSTVYYSQILRPIDSWTMVNRASLCCICILKRVDSVDFDQWEGDMFSRVFWNTLMYETIITQELCLPLSGLLEYEEEVPLPKFTPYPRSKTSISGLLVDDEDSFFNFHFLAQAAHRILLTRIRHNIYSFVEKEGSPNPSITAEIHHQIEQWRVNLPAPLQFSTDFAPTTMADMTSLSPAHVIAKDMLRSRYLVAKFHIGRPFLYKALHFPQHMTDSEYREIGAGLRGGMYWPMTMGLGVQMMSALPIKFGWCAQTFGQVLMFHAIARSRDERLRAQLPEGWEEWVRVIMGLIERCGEECPGIKKDAELLRLL